MRRPLRRLHPAAWWLWALLLAAAASQTTDVLLLALIVSVAWLVVVVQAPPGGRRVLRVYALVALLVLAVRVAFRVLLGGAVGGETLFTLPELPMPDWAVGIRIGGPVTTTELAAGFADGARLATLIICVGAANALADPRRMLRSLPRALHSIGTAVIVALALAPQLVASAFRIHRARSVRRVTGRTARLRSTLMPVIDDALDRTLSLAVAMEARGFGRPLPRSSNWIFASTALGLLLTAIGTYLLLDGSAAVPTGGAAVLGGLALGAVGLRASGRRRVVSTYRPEEWRLSEWAVVATGFALFAVVVAIARVDPGALHPPGMPQPPLLATLAVLAAASPAVFAPSDRSLPMVPELRPS